MFHHFDCLIESFVKDHIGIDPYFLDEVLASKLAAHLLGIIEDNRMVPAGIGNNLDKVQNIKVRTDLIYWLDRTNKNESENEFLDLMEDLIRYLNDRYYAGIHAYEFHFAVYNEFDFYKMHIDQFRSDDSRMYSVISYLNSQWKVDDGGQLNIRQNGIDTLISPVSRKTVFFKSNELQHEVLMNYKRRMSITGWLKKS
ncbi:MAG: 2OG-Fe(II) oxygenase [Cytophagales bacterium]|nr:2OG-Fe(II) oxygenase [Cytophagales bacterium]